MRGALVARVAAFSIAGWARPENCTAALIVLAVIAVSVVAPAMATVPAPLMASSASAIELRWLAASFIVVEGLPVTFTGPEVLTLMA